MRELNLRNVTVIAATGVCLMQIGAQLFALSVVASTVSAAPPRSFAILQGEYPYDSSSFWSTVPPITLLLLLIALAANWKTARRKLIVLALALFIVAGLVSGLYLGPAFDELKAIGFQDDVDPALQIKAATWYALDWAVWSVAALAGVAMLTALNRPVGPLSPKLESK